MFMVRFESDAKGVEATGLLRPWRHRHHAVVLLREPPGPPVYQLPPVR